MTAPAFDRYIPPTNFAYVENHVYRSGEPSAASIPFISTLKLRSVVWLGSEEPKEAFSTFVDEHDDLTLHCVGLVESDGQPWDPMTEETVLRALELIIDQTQHPVLVCCGMGRHRTGTVIGCLRRLQGWNLASYACFSILSLWIRGGVTDYQDRALDEYRRICGSRRVRIINELHIEAFQPESITLRGSRNVPRWVWRAHDQAVRPVAGGAVVNGGGANGNGGENREVIKA
ncbi:MAG: tyrosine-protein phosphatase required for protection against superoxide stress (By similarity) [Vezdaea aestivalis]|nr:MAG: tyrosine-protein phosphatase required for protection against superoxide stress (By similarity) [Vezdaea aestivalis]